MLSPKQAQEILDRALKWAEEQEKAGKFNPIEPPKSEDKPTQKETSDSKSGR